MYTSIDNDVMLLRNERFEIEPLSSLATTVAWVHCRPNILNQGRVVWYDEEKARIEREKALAAYLKMLQLEEMDEEFEEEESEEEEGEGGEEEMIESLDQPETGPDLLSSIANDNNSECSVPWLVRFTSKYTNQKERLLVMQSNVWPGAFTFVFEDICESMYLGWGHKFCTRNIPFKHLQNVQEEFPHGSEDFIEASDPTIEEELAYNEWLYNKTHKSIATIGDQDVDDEDLDEPFDSEIEDQTTKG